ncbi:MAG: urease accessory protein UreF, partial [Methylocella sp.]
VMTTATMTRIDDGYSWLPLLASWLSPAYPVGAYSYSHAIEWAVEAGALKTAADLTDYIATVLEVGAGWPDLVLAAASWRAAESGRRDALNHIAELGRALRPTSELALESLQQGSAFVATTRAAWPGTALDWLAPKHPAGIVYSVAVGAACAGRVPMRAMLTALCHAVAVNLASAGVRLVPLGQTDGQRAIAALGPVFAAVVARAAAASLADLGGAAPRIELYSMHHETQYTRLFRS